MKKNKEENKRKEEKKKKKKKRFNLSILDKYIAYILDKYRFNLSGEDLKYKIDKLKQPI